MCINQWLNKTRYKNKHIEITGENRTFYVNSYKDMAQYVMYTMSDPYLSSSSTNVYDLDRSQYS